MRLALLTLLISIAFSTYAQQPVLQDMTKVDITTMEDFDGAKVSFMGLHLGMNKNDAIEKLKTFKNLSWKYDEWNTKSEDPSSKKEMRIYVKLKDDKDLEDPTVLYLLWDAGAAGMTSMVFYRALAPMLTDNTVKLFTADALNASADWRGFLKGTPIEEKDNIGITTYHFKPQHFQLISYPSGGYNTVWFKLIE